MSPLAAITGGGGNLAGYVARALSGGYALRLLDVKAPEDGRPGEFACVDLLDLAAVSEAVKGADLIVHLGAIPHPMKDPAERVFQVNAMGTFNVMEAAVKAGVKRVVMASSDSILGFVFRKKELCPEYLPMDEAHPVHPQDPYALSKLVGEQICRSYTEAYGLVTVCLRFCHIWMPHFGDGYKSLVATPEPGIHNLWVYVDARDAAQAIAKSAEAQGVLHEVMYISGPDAACVVDSPSLARTHYPGVPVLKPEFTGHASFVSCAKARRMIGYEPQWSWRRVFGEGG